MRGLVCFGAVAHKLHITNPYAYKNAGSSGGVTVGTDMHAKLRVEFTHMHNNKAIGMDSVSAFLGSGNFGW